MKKTPRILYCHCAHAEVLPEATRAAVLEGLARLGPRVRAVADLCELAARHDDSLKDFSAGAVVVACHPRAVRWLFARAGAPLDESTTLLNMRTQIAGDILSHLAPGEYTRHESSHLAPGEYTGGTPGDKRPALVSPGPSRASGAANGNWLPWFPVIDYDRCQNCRQCQQFCLFGVYATNGNGRVSVVRPEKCKTNCPACARICPHAAIIFPKFDEGGPISGDDTPPPERPAAPIDFSSLAGLDFQEAIRRRSALLKQRQAKGSP